MAKECEKSENIIELCLFGVFGKYEEWERRFISNAICRALNGMDITLQKNVYFDYLWVEDLANIVCWFIDDHPRYKRYHVCRGQKKDLYSLAEMVRTISGVDCEIIVSQSGWKPEYTGSNQRLLEEIGGYEFEPFERSIRTLCDFYKKNQQEINVGKLI
jgi:GDP-L-fucose synthase